ncbi:MAG: aminotransferase class I/II-fold pyridoxal phosphate-dependent enzyme [Gammaproteobacteria bacterium]|nr:aminotransferase class I/II-fold pyridoxal phosphate-dependent enzyme [Gammaproteobacteria bacterium]
MSKITELHLDALADMQQSLARELDLQKANKLSLDLTRGKPAADQLDLSAGLESTIDGSYIAADGSDARNYGQLRGLEEARELGAEILDVAAAEIICWGNSSLNLMYLTTQLARNSGLWGDDRAWSNSPTPKIVTPVPGYDRHFTLSENLNLEMVNVPITQDGPDMAVVEQLVSNDASIKGIWCVPKFSNPTGCTYSEAVVAAMAMLPKTAAADDFVVFWDNAYAVHDIGRSPRELTRIMPLARQAGTADHIVHFASTSKITYASGGLGFVAASERVLANIEKRLSITSIGPDKVNQLRHARFLRGRVVAHMAQHAQLLRPKFQLVQEILAASLAELDIARWTQPEGGYFVSLDTRPGLARVVGKLAGEVGLALTPPGATFPYGADPEDRNLRIAPTFASLTDLKTAMEIFVVCLKLASVNDEIERRATL